LKTTDLKIEYIDRSRLSPSPHNARTHSAKQVRQIAQSIRAFGFTNPILIDEDGAILAGHGRVRAAAELDLGSLPCVRLTSMTSAQKRAYLLADNKLALNAGWDEEILAIEFEALLKIPDFDISLTGFSVSETDLIIESLSPATQDDPDDQLPPLDERVPPVTRLGDLWVLGEHQLYCGDSLEPGSFQTVLDGEKAQMVFVDPPYNVPIAGNVSGLGKTRHREFAMASGEMTQGQFRAFLGRAFGNLADSSLDGSIHFVCMDWRHVADAIDAGRAAYSELKNICVWVKDNGGMGTFYRSRHEMVLAFKKGVAPHLNTFELGQHGRNRTNVWEYRGMSSRASGRAEALTLHPTVKPVALIADALKDVSSRGGIVLDCFGGSGSTLIAAHKTGRRARLIEIDPLYVDRTIRRWQAVAHDDAILASTGQTFAQREKSNGGGAASEPPCNSGAEK
jgi:16S rRNA G966 N2-methylase RsmD